MVPVADADGDEEDDPDGDEVDLVEAVGEARHGDPPLAGRVHADRRAHVRREAARHGGVGEDVLHDQVRPRQERSEFPCTHKQFYLLWSALPATGSGGCEEDLLL